MKALTWVRLVVLAGLMAVFTEGNAGATATRIPLAIDAPYGLLEPWPVACGVPFPADAPRNAAALRIMDDTGAAIPAQVDVTATWPDGGTRWTMLHFNAAPGRQYFAVLPDDEAGQTAAAGEHGMTVDEAAAGITIKTGGAEYFIAASDALVSRAELDGRALLHDSGRGAYIKDQHGRLARLGGAQSAMQTSFRARGPQWTVVRKEGWYVTDAGERLARGIVWLHFFGDSPHVKLVHRLVLTEDTNEVWFKDIGLDFNAAPTDRAAASFAIARGGQSPALDVELSVGAAAWMLQDEFPHFMRTNSSFIVARQSADAASETLAAGAACGDWCDWRGAAAGFTVVIRDFAEQFPKEFHASPAGVTARLWAERAGRELDFRVATLIAEYWGEDWASKSDLGLDVLRKIPSNAQSSAKTHVLWFLPHRADDAHAQIAARAENAAVGVTAMADPGWICDSNVMGMEMHPKDTAKLPREELYISDFFDRHLLPNRFFPMTGWIAWGANMGTRYGGDPAPGKTFMAWWRMSGLTDYHMRNSVWLLYARSGERKYLDYATRFNRFAGDLNMHHWDCGDPASRMFKVRGGFAGPNVPKDAEFTKMGEAGSAGSLPIYWRWSSDKPIGGSGTDVMHFLYHFYFTGDWDVRELLENCAAATKKHEFMQTKGVSWGGNFTDLRCLAAMYSMDWAPELGAMLKNLADQNMDLNSPNGVSEKMTPSPTYKSSRVAISMLSYYYLTMDARARDCFLKLVDYQYKFQLSERPIAYQSASGLYNATATLLSGDEKYLRIAWQTVDNAMAAFQSTLADELRAGLDQSKPMPWRAAHYNYFPFVSLPVLMKARLKHAGPLKPLPILRKHGASTTNAWAVFEKPAGREVTLSMCFWVVESDDVIPVVHGPDGAARTDFRVDGKEKLFEKTTGVGDASYYLKLTLPADAPAGVYRVGHADRGSFAVLDAGVERISLECPEGFWLGNKGIEAPGACYFHVPDDCTEVKMFVSRPVEITRGDGAPATPMGMEISEGTATPDDASAVGYITLPVPAGTAGDWKVVFDGAAFIRLINLPPVVAYLTPQRLFVPMGSVAAVSEPWTPPPGKHVPGIMGGGLQLAGSDTLRLKRGARLPDGSYENFPGLKGTIEFWFRPNWDALANASVKLRRWQWDILSAGAVDLHYLYGQNRPASDLEACLDLWCGMTKFASRGRYRFYGNRAGVFPRAGEWMHLAVTWEFDPERRYPIFYDHSRIFINGRPYRRQSGAPDMLRLPNLDNFDLSQIAEWITLGGDGTFDELRFSDVVRYTGDFTPPDRPFTMDKNTKLLMHCDEPLTAIGAPGRPVEIHVGAAE